MQLDSNCQRPPVEGCFICSYVKFPAKKCSLCGWEKRLPRWHFSIRLRASHHSQDLLVKPDATLVKVLCEISFQFCLQAHFLATAVPKGAFTQSKLLIQLAALVISNSRSCRQEHMVRIGGIAGALGLKLGYCWSVDAQIGGVSDSWSF